MAGSPLILIANPGSASRKYALFAGKHERAALHFEWDGGQIICTLHHKVSQTISTDIHELPATAAQVTRLLHDNEILAPDEQISRIGLRIVAPGSYFLEDRMVDDEFIARLEAAQSHAPIHITATLQELHTLCREFAGTPIIGISDSAFHSGKPDYAWNYGIPLADADRFDIKRFGYHGIAAAAAVGQLKKADKLASNMVLCHLGSGASVTALHGGKSLDNTMGYSPLEGLVMATRSGSIDYTAAHVLKQSLSLTDEGLEVYLNHESGLSGLGGSPDLRELLKHELDDGHPARLALSTYIYAIQKAIGQMTAALGGVDALVFTGTVGERSAPIRERIVQRLRYLDFRLDTRDNHACTAPETITTISYLARSKPILVVPANESAHMASRAAAF